MYKAAHDETLYHQQLEEILSVDAGAGSKGPVGPGRLRHVRPSFSQSSSWKFRRRELRQPFETSLQDKKQRMDATIAALGQLVDYGIDEVRRQAT